MVFSMFPGASAGLSRALTWALFTNTTRIGSVLTLVGPILARSTAWRSNAAALDARASHCGCGPRGTTDRALCRRWHDLRRPAGAMCQLSFLSLFIPRFHFVVI